MGPREPRNGIADGDVVSIPMDAYAATVWAAYLALVLGAFVRSRVFGIFAIVILTFPAGVGLALRPHLGPLGSAMPYFQAAAAI